MVKKIFAVVLLMTVIGGAFFYSSREEKVQAERSTSLISSDAGVFNLPKCLCDTVCRNIASAVSDAVCIYVEPFGFRAINLGNLKFNATSHGLLLCFDIADGFIERIRHSSRQHARSTANFDLRRPVALCIGLIATNLS